VEIPLTIAIPTYNRKEKLIQTLVAISHQLNTYQLSNSVEVIVCDNSDLAIENLGAQVALPKIRYFFNGENIGQARNVNQLFMESKGQYVWILSDDDTLAESAISIVFERISRILGESIPAGFVTFLVGDSYRDNIWIKDETTTYWKSGFDFLKNNWDHPVFISNNILHRDSVLRLIGEHNLRDTLNDTYQNSVISFTSIGLYGNVHLIRETLVRDAWTTKIYEPPQGIRVKVLDLMKLHKHFSEIGFPKSLTKKLRKQIGVNLVTWGLIYSIVCREINLPFPSIKSVNILKISYRHKMILWLFNLYRFNHLSIYALVLVKLLKIGVWQNIKKDAAVIIESYASGAHFQTYDPTVK
jgi:glycosyltransferase involved in cell wall biosynthesis